MLVYVTKSDSQALRSAGVLDIEKVQMRVLYIIRPMLLY